MIGAKLNIRQVSSMEFYTINNISTLFLETFFPPVVTFLTLLWSVCVPHTQTLLTLGRRMILNIMEWQHGFFACEEIQFQAQWSNRISP